MQASQPQVRSTGQTGDVPIVSLQCSNLTGTSILGTLFKQGRGKYHYVSHYHWTYLFTSEAQLGEVIRKINAAKLREQHANQLGRNRQKLASSLCPLEANSTMPLLLHAVRVISRLLPSRAVCDQWIDAYTNSYYHLAPILDIPAFLLRYEELWTKNDLDPYFLALLQAVLSAGAKSFNQALAESHRLLAQDMVCLTGFPYMPTLDTLRAHVISHDAFSQEGDESTSRVSFTASAIQAAQCLGLHRDRSRFGFDTIQATERRRTWAQLRYLDVASAFASGQPPIIHFDDSQPRSGC